MFSLIRHIPHVHRLSSFCVTGYQHGRQETKTVTELKNISCRRSLSFCPPASTDYLNSCYFQAYELWNNGCDSRFHSKTFQWHWRFKILLVSTGALSLDPPPYPPNSISSQHKHHKWQPWRTGYKPVGACTQVPWVMVQSARDVSGFGQLNSLVRLLLARLTPYFIPVPIMSHFLTRNVPLGRFTCI